RAARTRRPCGRARCGRTAPTTRRARRPTPRRRPPRRPCPSTGAAGRRPPARTTPPRRASTAAARRRRPPRPCRPTSASRRAPRWSRGGGAQLVAEELEGGLGLGVLLAVGVDALGVEELAHLDGGVDALAREALRGQLDDARAVRVQPHLGHD